MNKFDPQLLKGIYLALILKLLKSNSEMYGYQIEKNSRILSDSGFTITEGILYLIFHKLEEKGFIKSKIKQVQTGKESTIQLVVGALVNMLLRRWNFEFIWVFG